MNFICFEFTNMCRNIYMLIMYIYIIMFYMNVCVCVNFIYHIVL